MWGEGVYAGLQEEWRGVLAAYILQVGESGASACAYLGYLSQQDEFQPHQEQQECSAYKITHIRHHSTVRKLLLHESQ